MEVDARAPVIGSSEIEIAASPELVWDVIATIDKWPSWNPAIAEVTLEGPVAQGTVFRWKAGPGTIVSVLRSVDPPRELAWTGKTMGIRAVHVYRLEPHGASTLVHTQESWSGLLCRLFRTQFQNTLKASLDKGLAALKAEAERRATR
jgi:hypothetical protein